MESYRRDLSPAYVMCFYPPQPPTPSSTSQYSTWTYVEELPHWLFSGCRLSWRKHSSMSAEFDIGSIFRMCVGV